MTHLPYIAAAYGITILAVLSLSLQALTRLRRARARLAVLEQQRGRRGG